MTFSLSITGLATLMVVAPDPTQVTTVVGVVMVGLILLTRK
ncbi:MAG: hypothetical protein ACRAVC_15945 [Trichormus sp.]